MDYEVNIPEIICTNLPNVTSALSSDMIYHMSYALCPMLYYLDIACIIEDLILCTLNKREWPKLSCENLRPDSFALFG